jgi:photosystem II stability/assembly factor-like uncharacterized protein
MTLRSRFLLPVLALSLFALVAIAVAPSVARADTLTWGRPWVGPDNYLTPSDIDVFVAGAFDAVSFSDAGNGWAVGLRKDNATSTGTYKSLIAHSLDGGATWQLETAGSSADELYGVLAIAPDNAWAVGANGKILHYTGGSWTSIELPSGWAGRAVRAIAFSGTTGWAVGDGLGIAVTIDGGTTWKNLHVPSGTPALRSVAALGDSHTAIAAGDAGEIESIDATSVHRRLSASSNLYGVTFAGDATTGWAVGDNATILRTRDGGLTWVNVGGVPLLSGFKRSQSGIRAVAFSDAKVGIAVGQYQGVWRTLDGGVHWTVSKLVTPFPDSGDYWLRGVSFVGASGGSPIVVGRAYRESLTEDAQKARAFVGTWADRVLPPPIPDSIAPVTTWPGWAATFVTKAVIVLDAADAGSGVANTWYKLDGGAETTGTMLSVTAPGVHTIQFRSVDASDNVEVWQPVKTFTVLIATKLSITSNYTTITHKHRVVFSGTISPNQPNGTRIYFYLRKSGSTHWSYLTSRTTYSSHHWSYSYYPPVKGTFYVQARYKGSTKYVASTSAQRKLTVR